MGKSRKGGGPPGANFPPGGGNAGDQDRSGPKDEHTTTTSGGGRTDNGDYRTQSKGGKAKAGGKGSQGQSPAAAGTGTASANPSGTASANPVTDTLRNMWRRERRCMQCGSENHFRANCPLTKEEDPNRDRATAKGGVQKNAKASQAQSRTKAVKGTATANPTRTATANSSRTATANSSTAGQKRKSHPGPTGSTPPSKKPARKHSYAAAASEATEMAIVTKDRGHIARRDFEAVRQAVEDKFIAQLNQNVVPLSIEGWNYTSHYATCYVADQESVVSLEEVVKSAGFILIKKETLAAERKPVTILTGLLQGPAARRERNEIERFLKFEQARVKIPGRIEFYSSIPIRRSGNTLLRIAVDDDAFSRMKELEFQLRIGASGQVRFEDERASKKTNKQTREVKIHELESSITDLKKKLITLAKEKRELESVETASVGTLGMSELNMEVDSNAEEPKGEPSKSTTADIPDEEVKELLGESGDAEGDAM